MKYVFSHFNSDMENDVPMSAAEKEKYYNRFQEATEKANKGGRHKLRHMMSVACMASLFVIGGTVISIHASEIGEMISSIMETIKNGNHAQVTEQQYVGYGDGIASTDVTKNDINAVVEGQKYIVDINQVYVDSLGQGMLLYEIYDKTGHELTEDELDISTIELGLIQNGEHHAFHNVEVSQRVPRISRFYDGRVPQADGIYVKLVDEYYTTGNIQLATDDAYQWNMDGYQLMMGSFGFVIDQDMPLFKELEKQMVDMERYVDVFCTLRYKDGTENKMKITDMGGANNSPDRMQAYFGYDMWLTEKDFSENLESITIEGQTFCVSDAVIVPVK